MSSMRKSKSTRPDATPVEVQNADPSASKNTSVKMESKAKKNKAPKPAFKGTSGAPGSRKMQRDAAMIDARRAQDVADRLFSEWQDVQEVTNLLKRQWSAAQREADQLRAKLRKSCRDQEADLLDVYTPDDGPYIDKILPPLEPQETPKTKDR